MNTKEQLDEIDRLWELKKQMVTLYNKAKTNEDYDVLLNHINDNLDPKDEQYLCMAIDCIHITFKEYDRNKELYNSIFAKYDGLNVDNWRTAIRLGTLEMIIEESKENK